MEKFQDEQKENRVHKSEMVSELRADHFVKVDRSYFQPIDELTLENYLYFEVTDPEHKARQLAPMESLSVGGDLDFDANDGRLAGVVAKDFMAGSKDGHPRNAIHTIETCLELSCRARRTVDHHDHGESMLTEQETQKISGTSNVGIPTGVACATITHSVCPHMLCPRLRDEHRIGGGRLLE